MISPVYNIPTSAAGPLALSASGLATDVQGVTKFYPLTSGNPVWQTASPVISVQSRVDAGADVVSVLRYDQSSPAADRFAVVKRYGQATGTPGTTYQFAFKVTGTPASGLHVSRDGRYTVAWVYNYLELKTVVAVYGPGSTVPVLTSINTNGEPRMSALSADGATLLLVSAIKRVVLKTSTGTFVEDYNQVNIGTACAISGNVWAVARSAGFVDVFGSAPFTIQGSGVCQSIKTDGLILVLAWSNSTVQVIDLATRAMVFGSPIAGTVADMDLSPDSRMIAVGGTWLTVFEYPWAKTYEENLPGDVADLDVSNDNVAVASKVDASSGRIDMFKRGTAATTEYRATIPFPAIPGSIHTAVAFPAGADIQVRVV